MNNKIALAMLAAGAVAVAGIATVNYIQISRDEKAAKRDSDLDIQAIKIAAQIIREKLDRGEYYATPNDLTQSLFDEIKFQKIALRTEI